MTDIEMRLAELDRIISEAEALKYGKREINERIFGFVENVERADVSGAGEQVAWVSRPSFDLSGPVKGFSMRSPPKIIFGDAPAFSYDLADARRLLDTGMLFSVEGAGSPHQQGCYGKATVWYDELYASDDEKRNLRIEVTAPNPELALCIAALKAKRSQLQSLVSKVA